MTTWVENNVEEMDPIISYEETKYGWRGLTSHGEVYEVKGSNGHKIEVPAEITVSREGVLIGRRLVKNEIVVDIDDYLLHFNRVVELYKANRFREALGEANMTMMAAPTLRARFNRGMILLACGDWRQGLAEYWQCEQDKPFMRPQVEQALASGLRPWQGEPLTGKRVLLLHAHGFGDTLMMLRYVPRLKKSLMVMPSELHKLAEQVGLVVDHQVDCDFFCPMLHLLYLLNVTPENVLGGQYLSARDPRSSYWRKQLGEPKPRIGVAWSVGKPSHGDYPREIDLGLLKKHLPEGAELHSVQTQGAERAVECGVIPHEFEDFADCAAFMMNMDEIISVDTAALHLAGAIGHPNVTGLLSYWHSWRWRANWYNNVRLLRQTSPNSWDEALAQL